MTDSDPVALLEKLRAANRGGDIHLVGGPCTIETFRSLGALDKLGLLVLPFFLGAGMQLTPTLSVDSGLVLEEVSSLPEGAVTSSTPVSDPAVARAAPRTRRSAR